MPSFNIHYDYECDQYLSDGVKAGEVRCRHMVVVKWHDAIYARVRYLCAIDQSCEECDGVVCVDCLFEAFGMARPEGVPNA